MTPYATQELGRPWPLPFCSEPGRIAGIGACLAWAVANNMTRNVSLADATFVAMAKGLVAGITDIGIAFASGVAIPTGMAMVSGGVLGFPS